MYNVVTDICPIIFAINLQEEKVMNKKFISIALAGVMAFSCAAVSASAADVEIETSKNSGKIQFDLGDWNHDDAGKICFYIWDETTGEWCNKDGWSTDAGWGSKKLFGTDLGDGIAESYEFSLDGREDHNVFIIFHDKNTDAQTYDCVLNSDAFGHKAYMTDNPLENPVDSEKKCIEAVFDGVDSCGPYKKVTSTGNIVGNCSAPQDNGAKIVAKYVFDYVGITDKSGVECCTPEKVTNAISSFGTDADSVWTEFQNLKDEDGYSTKEADAKKLINPSAGDDNNSSENNSSNGSSSNGSSSNGSSSNGSSSNSGNKSSNKGTGAAAATTTGTASTEAAAETGDTTGTAAFAVVLVAAAAAMVLARKKVEE